MAELNSDEICIKGNKYRILDPDESGAEGAPDVGMDFYLEQQEENERLGTLEGKVDRLIDIMGAGAIGGGYRSIVLTLNPREKKYEVLLGMFASQLHIRSNQGVIVNFNSRSGEDVFIDLAEFPFSLSELHKNEAIHSLYITTGATSTTVKILAFGMVY